MMPQTVEQVLETATFYTDDESYVFVKLPRGAVTAAAGVVAEISEPFCALMVDKDEVTLMIPDAAWQDFQRRLPGAVVGNQHYRLITLDVVLEPELVGLMAYLAQALAQATISILPYSAFSRDHIFVAESQFQLAINTLSDLKSQ